MSGGGWGGGGAPSSHFPSTLAIPQYHCFYYHFVGMQTRLETREITAFSMEIQCQIIFIKLHFWRVHELENAQAKYFTDEILGIWSCSEKFI